MDIVVILQFLAAILVWSGIAYVVSQPQGATKVNWGMLTSYLIVGVVIGIANLSNGVAPDMIGFLSQMGLYTVEIGFVDMMITEGYAYFTKTPVKFSMLHLKVGV